MNKHGIKLTCYRVGKLIAKMDLKSCKLKTYKYKRADKADKIYENLLNINFNSTVPNQSWTGGVTYIRI